MMYRTVCEVVALALTMLTWGIVVVFRLYAWNVLRMATWWVMTIQLVYFASAIALPQKRMFLREMRHVGRLLSIMMCLVFWMVFFYDRELILPRGAGQISGLNFLQHVLPPLLFLLDNRDLDERKPKLVYAVVVTLAYFAVILGWYAATDSWPYPFMQGLTIRSFQVLVVFSIVGIWGIHKLISQ